MRIWILVVLVLFPLSVGADEACDDFYKKDILERVEELQRVIGEEDWDADFKMCLSDAFGLVQARIERYCRVTNDFNKSFQKAFAQATMQYCRDEARAAGLIN